MLIAAAPRASKNTDSAEFYTEIGNQILNTDLDQKNTDYRESVPNAKLEKKVVIRAGLFKMTMLYQTL